jgi:hypothetical protein
VCKKDPGEVLAIVAPYVNRGIKILNDSRLVAIKMRKTICAAFLFQNMSTS